MLLVAGGILYFQNNSASVVQREEVVEATSTAVGSGFTKQGGQLYWNGNKAFIAHDVDRNLIEGTLTTSNSTLSQDSEGNWYENGILAEVPDAATFVALPQPGGGWVSFYKDKNHIYILEGQAHILNIFEGVDLNTFEVLGGRDIPGKTIEGETWPIRYSYLKDKDHVLFYDHVSGRIKIIPDADPSTFETADDPISSVDARDKNHYYIQDKVTE